jgi:hypothetical protein
VAKKRAKAHKVKLAKVIDNPAARREFKRRRLPEKLWEGLYEVLSSKAGGIASIAIGEYCRSSRTYLTMNLYYTAY